MHARGMSGRARAAGGSERGAVTLETVGLVLIAAMLSSVVFVALSGNNRLTQAVSGAVCTILTGGQGSCDYGTSTEAEKAPPTEPCATASDGYSVTAEGAAFNFTAGGTKAVTIEKLSNGKFRVVVASGKSAGVETGIGWDARVQVNGTRWGNDIGAKVGAKGDYVQSDVYLVDSRGSAEAIRNWAMYDQTLDTATDVSSPVPGMGWLSEHVTRPVTDFVADKVGIKEPPEPDAKVYTGGVSANASAQITPVIGGAEAKLGIGAVLGVRMNADGTTTVIGKVDGTAQLAGAISIEHGDLGGNAAFTVEATYDGSTLKSTQVKAVTTSDGRQTMHTWSLPVKSEADRAAATNLLYNPLPTAWTPFFDAAKDHGSVSKVDYETDGLDVSGAATVRAIEEGGVNAGFALPAAKVTSAEYYNGQDWAPWAQCSGR